MSGSQDGNDQLDLLKESFAQGPLCQEYILRGISLFWIKSCVLQAKLFFIPPRRIRLDGSPPPPPAAYGGPEEPCVGLGRALDPEALGDQGTDRPRCPVAAA